MKSILRSAGIILFSLFVSSAFGQQRGQQRGMGNMDPEQRVQNQVDQMKEIIKLDSKEEALVKEIFLKYNKERTDIMQAARDSGDRMSMRDKMTEMQKKQNEELKKVIGEKRFSEYDLKMQELRSNRGQRR